MEELESLLAGKDEQIKEMRGAQAKTVDGLKVEIKVLEKAEQVIKADYKKKEEHATALMEVKQKEAIFEAVNKVKEEYADKEKKLVEEHFGKLSTSMTELHEKGNANTQYIKDVSLKMIEVIGGRGTKGLLENDNTESKTDGN